MILTPAAKFSAVDLQDVLVARAKTLVNFKTLFRTPMETWQPEDLPALAVFIVEERMDSTGNAGEPHFVHDVNMGLQAVVVASDAEDQRDAIMYVLGQLDLAILTDPATLINIEEIKSITRRFKFERVAETPTAQFSSNMHVSFQSQWQPVVPDDFKILNVQTRFPLIDTNHIPLGLDTNSPFPGPVVGDTNAIQQVIAQWDITQAPFIHPTFPPVILPALSDASWTPHHASVSGTTSLVEDSTDGIHTISRTLSGLVFDNNRYALVAEVQPNGRDTLVLRLDDGAGYVVEGSARFFAGGGMIIVHTQEMLHYSQSSVLPMDPGWYQMTTHFHPNAATLTLTLSMATIGAPGHSDGVTLYPLTLYPGNGSSGLNIRKLTLSRIT